MDAPGFYFCICPDATLARDHLDDLLTKLAEDGTGREIRTWWAEDGLDDRFWEALTLQGLTDRPRVLLVRGAQALPADTWKKLSSLLGTPRPGVLPVFFLESPWEKGQPRLPAHVLKLRCLDFAGKQGWAWRAPGLEPRSLRRHVQERSSRMGLRLTPDALEALCDILAPDASAVQGVLDQLFLAAPPAEDGGPRVADADLARQMTAHTPEIVIFDFIRHLENGDAAAVWRSLLGEGDGGESMLFPLLGLLAREARLLWQLQVGESVYVPQHVAGAKRDLARRLGRTGLSGIWSALLEAEWAVKSGRRQPLQALEELVATLILVFGPAAAGGRG